MNFLQIFFLIASLLFLFYVFDLKKRKKIGILPVIILSLGAMFVFIMALNTEIVNHLTALVGINRGAELVVYCAIIFLAFSYLHLINKTEKQSAELTRLISQMAIQQCFQSAQEKIQTFSSLSKKDDYVVHMRVYNEATTLREQVENVINYGYRKILLINDGSRDNSANIIQDLQNQYPECLILCCTHTINRGGGSANKTGFAFLKQYADLLKIRYVITFDPDGQMDISDMETFEKEVEKGSSDIYLGSRFVGGMKNESMPLMRKRILKISRFITRLLYHVKVSDPHNGYRVYPIETLKKIEIQADGMHYANEINEQIHQLGLKLKEVPVHITYTDYSLGKGQKNSNSIKLGIEMLYQKFIFK